MNKLKELVDSLPNTKKEISIAIGKNPKYISNMLGRGATTNTITYVRSRIVYAVSGDIIYNTLKLFSVTIEDASEFIKKDIQAVIDSKNIVDITALATDINNYLYLGVSSEQDNKPKIKKEYIVAFGLVALFALAALYLVFK